MKFKKIILITFLLLTILTISAVSATENPTSESDKCLKNIEDDDAITLNEESFENIKTAEDDPVINSNEESSLGLNYEDNENSLASTNEDLLGASNDHAYKITITPSKIYSKTNTKIQAKVTDNGKAVVGSEIDLAIVDKDGVDWGNLGHTNSNGIFTVNDEFPKGTYKVTVTLYDKNGNEIAKEQLNIESIKNPKNNVNVKVPSKIVTKYKSGKLFKIKVKNYKGKPFKKFKLNIMIWKGKYHWKKVKHDFVIKTNNKGIAKFNTNKLSPGKYNVGIQDDNGKYEYYKQSKVIIKKTAKKSNSKYKIITTKAKTYWVSKKSGSFKVKTKIWDMTAGYMAPYKYIDTTLYKNGKQVYNTKYSVKYKINGKWTGWSKYGTTSTAHHRHAVSDGSTVDKIKVKVKKNVNSFM